MVGIAPPILKIKWDSLSFASTLYLHPIIDTLLDHAPIDIHDELRLGLQEALVNAAKHGNQLDPSKQISVQYARVGQTYWWIISDQGPGFSFPAECCFDSESMGDALMGECGRGLFILHQIFDEVHWCQGGKEVHLCKQVNRRYWHWLRFLGRGFGYENRRLQLGVTGT